MAEPSPGLGKAALPYLIGNAVSAAIPFLLLPVMTRLLPTWDYGVAAAVVLIITLIDALSVSTCSAYLAARWNREPDAARAALPATVLTLALPVILVWSLGGWLLSLADGVCYGIPSSGWLMIALIGAGNACLQVRLATLQMTGRAWTFAAIQILGALLAGIAGLVLVAWLDLGWTGRVLGQCGATLLFGVWALSSLVADGLLTRPSRQQLAGCLAYALPLLPHVVAGLTLFYADRTLVLGALGAEAVAVLAVAAQLAAAPILFHDAVNRAWVPRLYALLDAQGGGSTSARLITLRLSALFALGGAAWAAAVALAIPHLAGPAYAVSALPAAILALGYTCNGIYKLHANRFFHAGRTGTLSAITIGCSLATCGLLLAGIRWGGVAGAATAAALGQALLCVSVSLGSRWIASPPGSAPTTG